MLSPWSLRCNGVQRTNDNQFSVEEKGFNKEGSAVIRRAYDIKNKRWCVAKHLLNSSENKRTEAEYLRKLQHRFVIEYIAESKLNQETQLFMEWGGDALSQWIKFYPQMILENFPFLSYQMVQSLAFIHRKGIIHRDLNATNYVMINGIVKMIDFGHAIYKSSGSLKCTWPVAPPEVLAGMFYDESMDVWDLGLTFANMVNGKPIVGDRGENLLKNILQIFDRLPYGEVPAYDIWYAKIDKEQADGPEKTNFNEKISKEFADIINLKLFTH
uniref:Protein kinase domain-containing protein n=1 Tax=Panagrolaimus sp. ES5 TaxID=591445 RepID=A0AC34G671_9BILA